MERYKPNILCKVRSNCWSPPPIISIFRDHKQKYHYNIIRIDFGDSLCAAGISCMLTNRRNGLSLTASTLRKMVLCMPRTIWDAIACLLVTRYDLRGRQNSMGSRGWWDEIMQNKKLPEARLCVSWDCVPEGKQGRYMRSKNSTSLSTILKAWLEQMVNRSEMGDQGARWFDAEALINFCNELVAPNDSALFPQFYTLLLVNRIKFPERKGNLSSEYPCIRSKWEGRNMRQGQHLISDFSRWTRRRGT